ncbi:MAG: hypothetical protein SPL42_02850 [Bacteroidales bacterium]|nr:hypothetical protein [Bacteroidales bacterium]
MKHTSVILFLVGLALFGCNAQTTNSFSELYKNTDIHYSEPSYPLSAVVFHQGDGSDIPHIVLNVPARNELVMLSYDDFPLDKGMKTSKCPVLTFSDGSSAILLGKYHNYNHIDSISVSNHSFEALYLSCGKGHFNFQDLDLAFIKDEALREEIAYYYVIRDFEENMPADPTAVLLSQGGEEFYLTTVERVKNSCSLPKDKPVTCKAYLFEVFTKEGLFNEVVVYDIKPREKRR